MELRALVLLEIDLGRDVEDLVHRPPRDLLGEQDAQFVGDGLAQRREHEQHTEYREVRRQITRVAVIVVCDEIEQAASDEQLPGNSERGDDARGEDHEQQSSSGRVHERNRQADRAQGG